MSRYLMTLLAALGLSLGVSLAIVDDARSFAIEAGLPWLEPKDGKPSFVIREAWWSGDTEDSKPTIHRHQLFKRNEYWFWAATSASDGKISIAIYDSAGKLVKPVEEFNKGSSAGVKIIPPSTGTYFIRVVAESATEKKPHWAIVYGYR